MLYSMGRDEKVLSYGDVVLRKSDLEILQGPYYLNDSIIEFYFCYLSSSSSSKIVLIGPSVSFFILHASDVSFIEPFLNPLKLPEKDLVIFPINDNEDINIPESGTHWSLLVYNRKKNAFEHYDSLSLNTSHARNLVSKIKHLMGPPAASSTFTDHFTPRQTNSYDCGIYVLAIAKQLCSYGGEASDEDWELVLRSRVTPSAVREMRNQILGIIIDLRKQ